MGTVVESYIMEFAFFIVFALLGTIISMRLKQPYVVGLLVFGLIAGPSVLGAVSHKELIATFTELGAILLLFTVGIEFSISRLFKSGIRALAITALKMGLLFVLGYEAALYFGLGFETAFFVGAMVSITSTALLFKIVNEKGMGDQKILPLLFSMLIFEDIFAVAALTLASGMSPNDSYEERMVGIVTSLGMLGAFYIIVRKPASAAIFRLTSTLNQDLMILVSFSVCLVMSMVATFLGVSPAIGAFLAGSMISSLPNSRKIERVLHPMLLLFASLFFLSLGMRVDLQSVYDHWGAALALTALFIFACFSSVFVLLSATGSKPRDAIFGASAMCVLGEFSLIIASQASADGEFLISVGSIGVIATAIFSSYLLDRQERLFALAERHVPYQLWFALGSLSAYFAGLLRDFSPGGGFWKISNVCWECVRKELGRVAVVIIAIVLARFAVQFFGFAPQDALRIRASILVLGAFPLLYYAVRILREIKPIMDSLSRTIARHGRNARAETVILRDLAFAIVFGAGAFFTPELVNYLQLPPFFALADELLILISLVFLWDIARNAGKLRLIGKRHIVRAKGRQEKLQKHIHEKLGEFGP